MNLVMGRFRSTLATLLMAVLAVASQPITVHAAEPVPPFIMPTAPWLSVVNYYRAMAGLGAVAENTSLSPGAYNHSCYMLWNGISHDEQPGLRGYTTSGDTAGNNGNVAVSSGYDATDRNHIDLWMTGPFHAIGILRYNLQSVGYGKCTTPTNTYQPWKSAATLNVLTGLNYSIPRPSTPILFPGNGTTTALNKFIAESPNPVSLCKWTGSAGLPVIAMMPERFTSITSATITGPTGVLPTCALHAGNTSDPTAKAILGGDNAVTVLPRAALTNGVYTVRIVTNTRTVQWSFTVDSAAATGIMPIPTVSPVSGASAYTAMTPFRLADSRTKFRITALLANTPKKIKVAGVAGIPLDATALSANFTVVGAPGAGHLTVYNCTAARPTASTLNYYAGETVANAGLFPLSSAGELCLFSPQTVHLVIDVTGYFRPSSNLRFEGLEAIPLLDTTTRLRSAGRTASGQTLTVNVPGAGIGVPAGAAAVAVNITGIKPSESAYVTAYPCGVARPLVSNLNPIVGTTKQNFAIVPLSASGTICLYTLKAMDLKVDVLGYFTPSGPHTMVPSTPTRVTDTRDLYRTQMNLGTSGSVIPANTTKVLQLAGQRGIPVNASVMSVNVVAVAPTGTGSLTLWDCSTQPDIQTINFRATRTVANGVQVQLSTGGAICIRSTVATHLVIDVTGWWT
jgi:hypothetical protein